MNKDSILVLSLWGNFKKKNHIIVETLTSWKFTKPNNRKKSKTVKLLISSTIFSETQQRTKGIWETNPLIVLDVKFVERDVRGRD